MPICAGGSCSSLYMSTITTFASAFGIPLFEYLHYFNFIVFFLIGFQLLSLYSAKKSFKYAPFLLALTGSILILLDMFVWD